MESSDGHNKVGSKQRKSSLPGLLRDKLKFKAPWSRNKDLDDETLRKVDVFVKDIIEKAKEEYLAECNGGAADGYIGPDSGAEDYSAGEDAVDESDRGDKRLQTPTCAKAAGVAEGNGKNHTVENTPDKHAYHERKPLIQKSTGNRCGCFRYLRTIFCCHCFGRNYDVT